MPKSIMFKSRRRLINVQTRGSRGWGRQSVEIDKQEEFLSFNTKRKEKEKEDAELAKKNLVVGRFGQNSGPALRVHERYVANESECPFLKWASSKEDVIQDQNGRWTMIVPTASTLDGFLKVIEQLLRCMDANVVMILLGSVLEKLHIEGKTQTLEKLRSMTKHSGFADKKIIVFGNQFTIDRQTNIVLKTVTETLIWMRSHIQDKGIDLVALSENEDFIKLVKSKHLKIMSTCEYVETLSVKDSARLLDIANSIAERHNQDGTNFAGENKGKGQSYTANYWSERKVEEQLKAGTAFSGKLKVNPMSKSNKCMVARGNSIADGTVNKNSLNRAIHGDKVVVSDDKVVAVLKRNWRPYVASLSEDDKERLERERRADRNTALVCIPMDPRIPKIRITTRHAHLLLGQRFVVVIDDWPVGSKYPQGHYIRSLGPIGDMSTESNAILNETGLDGHLNNFTPKAISCLPKEGHQWNPKNASAEQLRDRKDLRGPEHLIFSVDPPGCQDIDDAMSYKVLDEKEQIVQVGVHIADVTSFVSEGSALDKEAAHRATSVYLQDRRLDMLPRLLCEDLCSLCPNVDRFAVSVIWTLKINEIGKDYSVKDVWIGRTLINSAHALSYGQAQRLMDGLEPGAETAAEFREAHTGKPVDAKLLKPLGAALKGLDAIASWRLGIRQKHGALDLESGEFKFSLDATTQKPQDIASKKTLAIHGNVAELMIMANEQVARRIVELHPQAAVVRRHTNPPEKKLALVLELAKRAKIDLDKTSNATLAKSMAKAKSSLPVSVYAVVNDALTLAMSEAEYVCAGLVADFRHFGLGLDYYTHFTSPIRRYADVMVHRQLLVGAKESLENREVKDNNINVQDQVKAHVQEQVVQQAWAATAKSSAMDEDLLFGGIADEALQNDDLFDSLAMDSGDLFDELDKNLIDGDDNDILSENNNENDNIGSGDMASHSIDDAFLSNDSAGIEVEEGDLFDGIGEPIVANSKGDIVNSVLPSGSNESKSSALQPEITEHINTMHRCAKDASFRSEDLFFSLYFQSNPQIVDTILVGIREYALECFVPKFQSKILMRFDAVAGSMTIAGVNGDEHSQADGRVELLYDQPAKVELRGNDSSSSSSSSSSTEEYQSVYIEWLKKGENKTVTFQLLDQIPGYLCCQDGWTNRVPKPQLFLVDRERKEGDETMSTPSTENNAIKSFVKEQSSLSPKTDTSFGGDNKHLQFELKSSKSGQNSLYTVLCYPPPQKEKSLGSTSKIKMKKLGKGRMRFGGFEPTTMGTSNVTYAEEMETISVNAPKSFSAIQNDHRARQKYVDEVTRDATRRMERLHAAKRDTKIKKRIKASKG